MEEVIFVGADHEVILTWMAYGLWSWPRKPIFHTGPEYRPNILRPHSSAFGINGWNCQCD